MASLAESSIASVPLSKLAQLHDYLLQEPTAVNALQPEARNETHASGVDVSATNDGDLVIPESANAYQTPKSSPKGPSQLSASKSTPAAEMEAMIQPSPSQEAFTAMTRASSFHGYSGGDTQPMESQVYRDYTESAIGTAATTPKKTVLKVQISPDGKATYDTVMSDKTPRTCVEGETGFIDLENAWQPSSPAAQSTSSNLDDLLVDAQTEAQVQHEFVKPQMPETPSIAGQKHDRNGEILTSPTTTKGTPGFSQLFGGHQKGRMLTGTQLFDQTQAPSSPMPDGPRSDPVITRPSPALHNQYSVSSPTVMMSSPIATTHSRAAMPGEPRASYTSMRESQERRTAKLREELGFPGRFHEDNLEEVDEDNDMELRYEHKKIQRVMSDQALHEWSRVRAPSRQNSCPNSRPTSSAKRPTTIDVVTPAINKVSQIDFDVSDDGKSSADDVDGEDEPPEDAHPSDDEYDELAQTVLRSQGGDEQDSEGEGGLADNRDAEDEHVADEHIGLREELREELVALDGYSQREQVHLYQTHERGVLADTQHSAVADSQPVQHGDVRPPLPQQDMEPSSTSGFVPGSQYTGKTSQDQTLISLAAENTSSRPYMSSINKVGGDRVPSSPPLQPAGITMPNEGTDDSMPELQVQADVRSVDGTDVATKNEIPESDLPGPEDVGQRSSRPSTANERARHESNSMPLLSTARTHVSASGQSPKKTEPTASPLKTFASHHSKVSSQSPRTAAGVRHFADIAAATSPPLGSAETELDIDAIMSDVVTADDQDFMNAVSDPPQEAPQKRRKLTRNESTSTSPPSKANKPSAPRQLKPDQVFASQQHTRREDATGEPNAVTTALHDSPSKANELRAATPPQDEQPEATPESVKSREKAGAKAASQLLSSRAAKAVKASKSSLGVNKKAGANAPAVKPVSVPAERSKTKVAIKPPPKPKSRKSADASIARSASDVSIQDTINGNQSSGENVGNRVEDGQAHDKQESIDGASTEDGALPPILAPNRVFALFKGSFNNFYPATWLASSPDGMSFRIKFDDTTVTMIDKQHVRHLDLHLGDTVKVDVAGMRNKTWLVEGFGGIAQGDAVQDPRTDVYGRANVKVRLKSTGNNASARSSAAQAGAEVLDVAMTAVYLTHTLWSHFVDRTFNAASSNTITSRAVTPSTGAQTPEVQLSASRSGRSIVPTAKAKGGRSSNLREETVVSPANRSEGGLFSGMAFAISYGNDENQKADITRQILRNGGVILGNGFDELFNLPSLAESAPTSPTKKLSRQTNEAETDTLGLQLKAEHEELGFVALIADRYSRRAKYVQALALGLPTLSGRWIIDSLDPLKNSNISNAGATPLPWTKYLLAAGESAYLGGAIRSRTIQLYDAAVAKLSDTIENRGMLLNGDGVLIVAPKKGKATWERRKAFAFLTLAIGAGCVKRVSDLTEAKGLTVNEPEKWKWIYVDGSVADASAVMFGKTIGAGKKRKRGDEVVKVDAKAMSAGDGKVRIVNDEFVIQSLILGSLVD